MESKAERDDEIEDFLIQHCSFDWVSEFARLRDDVRAIPDVDPGEVFFAVSVDPYSPESEDRRTTRIKTPAVRDTYTDLEWWFRSLPARAAWCVRERRDGESCVLKKLVSYVTWSGVVYVLSALVVGLYIMFALLLGGCSGPKDYYTFAFEGEPDDFAAAEQATAEWQACKGPWVQLTYGRVHDDDTAITYEDDVNGQPGTDIAGVYHRGWNAIVYTHHANVAGVIAHEMGHAMGLQHFGHGVMQANLETTHVTSEDCAALLGR